MKITPNKVRAVNAVTCPKPLSQTILARKHAVSQPYTMYTIHVKILTSHGLKSCKKQEVPNVKDKNCVVKKLRLDRLYRHVLSKNRDLVYNGRRSIFHFFWKQYASKRPLLRKCKWFNRQLVSLKIYTDVFMMPQD